MSKRRLAIATACLILAGGGGFAYWRLFVWQPAVVDPFSAKLAASMQFPLYYPTRLPNGFRIDKTSVTVPQAGVAVFTIVGPHNEKLYMSEEARPTTFDIGGFYKKFSGLRTANMSYGEIAVGRINNGATEIGSLAFATNKTWVLTNTSASIPLGQLVTMLKSLTLNY
jgi:hypothetical protein